MDPNEVLTKAWTAVQESGVPESLYETAFKEAVALIAKPVANQPKAALANEAATNGGEEIPAADSDALLTKFATESGIDFDELAAVFYFDGAGAPHLSVAARKLGATITKQAQAAATALVAAYFFARDETQVGVDKVFAEAKSLKCLDKNFNRHMGSVAGATLSGPAGAKVLRARQNDIQEALRTVVNTVRGTKE
jgi:hypothetical protein